MIFKKNLVDFIFTSKETLWSQNFIEVDKLVNGRKYTIYRSVSEIRIVRRLNDLIDTFGFLPLRMVAIAKGNVRKSKEETHLNLIVSVRPLIEIPFIAFIILIYSTIFYYMPLELNTLLFLSVISVFIIIYYMLIKYGKNKFVEELRNDIEFFELIDIQ